MITKFTQYVFSLYTLSFDLNFGDLLLFMYNQPLSRKKMISLSKIIVVRNIAVQIIINKSIKS